MSKVTILMAVYNAEEYLHKSLDSLLHQTLTDIQIVCIDDASTDSSLKILNEYQEKDKRVNVLHLSKNHGQAYARNKGIEVATGEYITMLDADDWMSWDALEMCVDVFEKYPLTDCVLLDVKNVLPDGTTSGYSWHYTKGKYQTNPDGSFVVMSGRDAFMESLNWGIHGVCMDRATLYEKYPYDASSRFFSDDNTARLHFLASREVRCSVGVYYYFQHPSSASHQVSVRRMDWIKAADSMRTQLEKINISSDVLNIWEYERWKIIVDCYWFLFINWNKFSSKNKKYCLRVIKRGWKGVNLLRLKGKTIKKFGWYPFKGHWKLFQLEEKLYFSLRWLIGRR